ncbi:MAG TPA: signal peptidase II [Acidimicrobiia bacterium]|nr:signal peptidase II [Acidimicrobiia bacterium]
MRPRLGGLVIAASVIALDQLTKWWAAETLPGAPITVIPDFLQLRYVTNSGAAFGFFSGGGPVLAVIAFVVIVGILVVVVRTTHGWAESVVLGLVIGGAAGNLIDRVTRGEGLLDGAVVDFIDFSFFPAFNVADSAITLGAVFALWLASRRP